MTVFHPAKYTLFMMPASPRDEVVGFSGGKQVKNIGNGRTKGNEDLFNLKTIMSKYGWKQERIKGTEKASPIHTLFHRYFVSSYFRIGIKLPSALPGCFEEVSHD